jgi:hypothetical protein
LRKLCTGAPPGDIRQFRCLEQDAALALQASDGGQQLEPAPFDHLGRFGAQLVTNHAPSKFQAIDSCVEFEVETAHG